MCYPIFIIINALVSYSDINTKKYYMYALFVLQFSCIQFCSHQWDLLLQKVLYSDIS